MNEIFSSEKRNIVYVVDSYPIPSAIDRQIKVIERYFPEINPVIFAWDRNHVGKNEFIDNIVKIKCKKRNIGYGRKNINMFSFLKELRYYFDSVSYILSEYNAFCIVLVDWKMLYLLNFINSKELIVYLVRDMPSKFLEKLYEAHFLKKKSVSEIWIHSPYFHNFYKKYETIVRTVRVLPPKSFFDIARNLKRPPNNKPKKILFHGGIRYKKNIITLIEAVESFNGKVILDIYGYGPDDKAIRLFLDNKRIKFTRMMGRFSYNDVPKIIENYDIISILYPRDSNAKYAISNKFYEAILFEKPILCTSDTATSWITNKYKIGVDVKKPNNKKHVIKAIQKIIETNSWSFDEAKKLIRPFEEEFRDLVEDIITEKVDDKVDILLP